MGFPKEKKEQIMRYLLNKIDTNDEEYVRKTSQTFDISSTTIYRYIDLLCKENIIRKTNGKVKHELVCKEWKYAFLLENNLEEDIIYKDYIKQFIETLPSNVNKIWEYSFSEMLNNAIDHSESDEIHVQICQNYLYTRIIISDNGVGIFKKICMYFNFAKIEDAIIELFKGKLTTDPNRHSGEGIFFTSRIMDIFCAWSDNKIFTHYDEQDKLLDVERDTNFKPDDKGTSILMRLSNYSRKQLSEIFDEFSSVEGGFTVTSIPMKNIFDNAHPVSRSQAKRLCNRLDKFEEVILDFEGVESIGQGFAHELFIVFQKSHQNIELLIRNANEEVEKMIRHVKS